MSNEELLNSIKQMIDASVKRMAEMCGMLLHKKPEGFTQEDSSSMNGVPCVKAKALLPDYTRKEQSFSSKKRMSRLP